jgi:hypothetical protein
MRFFGAQGIRAISSASLPRLTMRLTTTWPSRLTACTAKTFFARSIPTVVSSCMTSPPGSIDETHHLDRGT